MAFCAINQLQSVRYLFNTEFHLAIHNGTTVKSVDIEVNI